MDGTGASCVTRTDPVTRSVATLKTLRDSKDSAGAVLSFPSLVWQDFLAHMRPVT
ncbi:DUF397 domain-containing protein [Streptomyces sp. JW3]|uniref:DUF397 domain-containing protein n=1 Tax=Streptomyces sp. JW3 TaxID=3456955 RepID=UPI003FA46334